MPGRAVSLPPNPMADTLVCTVELSKTDGVTITVKNEKGKITQTVVMDGTSIKTQVKGDKHTSLITQMQNSVVTKVSKGSKALSTVTQKEADLTVDCELAEQRLGDVDRHLVESTLGIFG